jgi:hypothetical protein
VKAYYANNGNKMKLKLKLTIAYRYASRLGSLVIATELSKLRVRRRNSSGECVRSFSIRVPCMIYIYMKGNEGKK